MARCYSKPTSRHGHRAIRTPTYASWEAMRCRCLCRSQSRWKDYGGRGITICDAWNSFPQFLADMGERPKGKSLDRIDNTKGYCPENCRWATPKEQARNRRDNIVVDGLCLKDWAVLHGTSDGCVFARMRQGYSLQEAINWAKNRHPI